MPHNRFFIDSPFYLHARIDLRPQSHHLRVMRIQKGDVIELVNGQHKLAKAKIVAAYEADILSIEHIQPLFPIILCQAICQLGRLDTIVEKGTELGMTELWLFPGQKSEKKTLRLNQLNRLKQITIASMKQCGRLDLPKIEIKPPLVQWGKLLFPAYFGDFGEKVPFFSQVIERKERLFFFIGPESGFTLEEKRHLQHIGARKVTLHPWTLRTDTASIVALSLISASKA